MDELCFFIFLVGYLVGSFGDLFFIFENFLGRFRKLLSLIYIINLIFYVWKISE